MRLVIDTNVAYLLFSRDPFVRTFVLTHKLELYAPRQLFNELVKDKEKVCVATRVSGDGFDELYDALVTQVIHEKEVSADSLKQAELLISDANDAPFLALAVEMGLPIWSNDKHFTEQAVVQVYTVAALKALLMRAPPARANHSRAVHRRSR